MARGVRAVPTACRMLCSNVWCLQKDHSHLIVAPSHYDILWCYETFVHDLCHVYQFLEPEFVRVVLFYRPHHVSTNGAELNPIIMLYFDY